MDISSVMEYLPAIISAAGTIIAAWFAYNQYSKNKLTDLMIEQFKSEERTASRKRNDSSAIVFGELWSVLYRLDADRVYIVQPHPLGNEEMLSVYYEVKRKGIQGMKERVQRIRMSDMPSFSGELGRNRMMFISDVDTQVQDELVKAMFSLCGCECLAVRRLNDGRHDWVGSLFCEYTEMTDMDRSLVECVMDEAAMNIQYILPDYR